MSFHLTSQITSFESFLQLTLWAVGNGPKHVIWVGNGPKHVICAEIRRLDATTICVDVLTGIPGSELKDGVGRVSINCSANIIWSISGALRYYCKPQGGYLAGSKEHDIKLLPNPLRCYSKPQGGINGV